MKMNKIHKQRFFSICLFLCGLAIATSLILFSLKQNINVFLTPSELTHEHLTSSYYFRLGGMVKTASVKRDKQTLQIEFVVTDFKRDVVVDYTGVLPDLFREGKGVIATGQFNSRGIFVANQVLAKHDENYMPKNMLSLSSRA